MAPGAFSRRDRFIVPGESIQAIRTIDLDLSLFQEPAGGLDEALVFILVIGSFGGREEDDGVTCMTEYEHLEVPADDGRMPFVIYFSQIHFCPETP
jgi:hypothetical protein